MNKQIIYFLLFLHSFTLSFLTAQNTVKSSKQKVSRLFRSQTILPLKLTYSNIELKKNTNDSTYLKTIISYKTVSDGWKDIEVDIRARGKFRREKCYYVPVKYKIKKSKVKGTLFRGQKKLKLVLPCLLTKDKNDNVVKEFIAYKLYEAISDFHFKTRLVDISLSEVRRKKIKQHQLKGILIEDDKKAANRYKAKVLKRAIHPLRQDNVICVKNAFFQFMIGNVDFSIAKRHNAKLLYINKKIVPIPYDFDMCGLVNPSYEEVSQNPNNNFNLTSITQRKFRGLKRDVDLYEQVRQEFLNNKAVLMGIVESFESEFENKSEYTKAYKYIASFFTILSEEKRFKKEILDQMRS